MEGVRHLSAGEVALERLGWKKSGQRGQRGDPERGEEDERSDVQLLQVTSHDLLVIVGCNSADWFKITARDQQRLLPELRHRERLS